jgi:exodeoxyribonuclease V alpha subunit
VVRFVPADSGADAGADAAAVFSEFIAAGLWAGVGSTLAAAMSAAGITGPADVTEEALAALPKVTAKRANRLYLSWIGASQSYALAELLVPQGIPARTVLRLSDTLGVDPVEALRADPWRLLVLPEITVAQADRLALAVDGQRRRDDPRRARALVDWTLGRFAREGHTAAPVDVVADALSPTGLDTPAAVTAAVEAAIAADLVIEVADPTGGGERWVARAALAQAETVIADRLLALSAVRAVMADPRTVAAACEPLDEVQAGAVANAATHGVSVLTGGPGTGKSRTVSAMVTMARSVEASVALAAPTGRAAKRLAELAGDDAMTVHRLLGARRGPDDRISLFEHDADNPIHADLVVIDEASMLDVELAAALLAAIPNSAHLVLVGDPAQLPSIGPGRVLGDILDAGVFPMTELSTLYRQTEGGAIARLATAVRAGTLSTPDSSTKEVVVVSASGSAEAARRVVQLVTDSIPRVFGLSGEQIQVVTPVHRGAAGTAALNRELKAVLNPGRGAVRGFDVGDRVVATANYLDAEPTGYANGEVGTVLETGEKSLLVAFAGGESEISGKALGDLLHGWAITVHRAQGSEWEAVIAVLPPEAGSMLSRPLVYTALTRARTHLSVVHAAGPVLARAVRHVGARPRRTRLAALLSATAPATGRSGAARAQSDSGGD